MLLKRRWRDGGRLLRMVRAQELPEERERVMMQILSDVATVLVVALLAWLVFSIGRAAGRTDRPDDLDEAARFDVARVEELEAERDLLLGRIEELRDRVLFAELAQDVTVSATVMKAAA